MRRTEPWSEAAKHAFAELPVQDGGRVKPMDSLAGLKLLTFNGKRSLKLADGSKLDHRAWMLDVLFFPEQAREYPCFRIQTDGVPVLIGIEPKKKRDWYSYDELLPGRQRLAEEARKLAGMENSQLSEVQRQTRKLASDLMAFESLLGTMDFARLEYATGGSEALREVYGEGPSTLSQVLAHGGELQRIFSSGALDGDEGDALRELSSQLGFVLDTSKFGVTMLPPPEGVVDTETWWTPGDVLQAGLFGAVQMDRQIQDVAHLERLEATKTDPAAFTAELEALRVSLREQAEARGEYGHIPLEVRLYDLDLFWRALYVFLVGFLCVVGTWLLPAAKLPRWGAWGFGILGFLMVATGIVLRCIIRERPPVVSLYDTILFVTACGVFVLLALEAMTRLRVALSLASLFGVAGMFLAGRYEVKEVASAGDTMASVIAVLDTNYYLAIHVTTVTLGYVGGLVAGLLAHAWIFGQLFGMGRRNPEAFRTLARMIYGVLCFCLFFAMFGTIMGGVWANDSWGRFWGWDPKENGALIICLWVLIVLHARLGGYIQDRGLAVMAVATGAVVSASWWGVNLLNVGLHSYGFTSGVALLLAGFWIVELLVMGISLVHYLVGRQDLPAEVAA
ncbi:MAG: cytochrome c biogenesis protein CcsA [Planctomycetes bacterium]|nr:cytochrome c biogenesis protein CcsA [Planctomycetota bacterium]